MNRTLSTPNGSNEEDSNNLKDHRLILMHLNQTQKGQLNACMHSGGHVHSFDVQGSPWLFYAVSEPAKVILDKSKRRSYATWISREHCPVTSTSNRIRSGDHRFTVQ